MKRLKVDPHRPEPEVLAQAVAVLARGGIVAFPTETVYGLAVDAGSEAARERLYRAKGRDPRKASAFLVADMEAALRQAPDFPLFARRIAEVFWPGPLTLVVPGPEGRLVGFRLPSEAVARTLASSTGFPLLQSSANRSGMAPALSAAEVAAQLGDTVDLLLDAGRSQGGRASTVVQCDRRAFTILRESAVSKDDVVRAASDLYLVACTGNLCRSPLAEALLRSEVAARLGCDPAETDHHGARFASFGISAAPGHPASEFAAETGRELGVDLSGHRSRAFSIDLLSEARRTYTLARNHRAFLEPYFRDRPEALRPLRPEGDVPDPIGQPLSVYRKAAAMIAEACRQRADEIVEEGPAPLPPPAVLATLRRGRGG